MSTVIGKSVEETRSLIKLCNDGLADAVDLQLQCKHAFWNTTDPDLAEVRELFDELSESVEDYADRIAARAVELGGIANSTERVVETWSHVLCAPDACRRNHAPTIANALASFGELVRRAIETASDSNDSASAEVFTEISEGLENWRQTIAAK